MLLRVFLVGVLQILGQRQADLLQVALAGGAAGVLPHGLEDGEQDRGQHRDDGDDDEQLDQREGVDAAGMLYVA